MKFWIMKDNDKEPIDEWENSYVFTINRNSRGTLYSNLRGAWYHLDKLVIDAVYEDIYIIALSIFGIDKRALRKDFSDNWTRDISVSIPVLEFEKWRETKEKWNKMLSFLTGDRWHIEFRPTTVIYSQRSRKNRKRIDISRCNCVSLFSGGLDSFCGAIKILESGKSPCLIGHNEYPKLRAKQESFAALFRELYPEQDSRFIGFTAGTRSPYLNGTTDSLCEIENTTRGRSLLFLSSALTIASVMGKETPVYIPENGFIGVNVALTSSRKGSCSTRTTHPYFLKEYKSILLAVGIMNPIENIFAHNSKREIVNMVKDCPAFLHGYMETISCSHPCQARYNKSGSREYPMNCGYCYPCLVRKSSLLDVEDAGCYSYNELPSVFLSEHSNSDKSLDLSAIIHSVYRFKRSSLKQVRQQIRSTGPLTFEEVGEYERLYISGMNDIVELLSRDTEMEKYI